MSDTSRIAVQVGGYDPAVTAAGSAYTDATVLRAALNVVTAAPASSGVRLQNLYDTPTCIVVRNLDSDTIVVYPPVGGSINQGSANAGVSLAQNKTGQFWPTGDGTYMFALSA